MEKDIRELLKKQNLMVVYFLFYLVLYYYFTTFVAYIKLYVEKINKTLLNECNAFLPCVKFLHPE